MIYNSFLFVWLFPILFLIGNNLAIRYRKYFLLLSSYALYINYNQWMALILFTVTFISFSFARLIDKAQCDCNKNQEDSNDKQDDSNDKPGKGLLYLGVLGMITPLFTFKYYDFIASNLDELGIHLPSLSLVAPLGVSFFTFQALSYLFDIYRQKYKSEKSLINYMAFLSFFPSMIAGPINRYNELMPQIKTHQGFDRLLAENGLKMILWGMFLKVVVADRLQLYVDLVFDDYQLYSGSSLLMASILYSFQLYTDFAGYSLMAIGTASTLGYRLTTNFRNPYFSISITDFWHRWHITLAQWLRDYIYIPLGGNRCSKTRNYLNILITFLVSGIWHGANWTFILWGLLHGISQVIEKMLGIDKSSTTNIWKRTGRAIFTFLLITLFWIFFKMSTLGEAMTIVHKIVTQQDMHFAIFEKYIIAFCALAFIKDLIDEVRPTWNPFHHHRLWVRWCTYIFVLTSILLFGVFDAGQFIYARF